jgi:hypothetical protein
VPCLDRVIVDAALPQPMDFDRDTELRQMHVSLSEGHGDILSVQQYLNNSRPSNITAMLPNYGVDSHVNTLPSTRE